MDSPQTVALIPARMGSKGIPRKNLADLGGTPLVEWTIDCALRAPSVTAVWVSTDDPAVAEVAESRGVRVLARPAHLATDTATTADVVAHALDALDADHLVLLQPTSPFRSPSQVEGACALHASSGMAVVSVVANEHPTEWCFAVDSESGLLRIDDPQGMPRRRQDAIARFRLNGAIYVASRQQWGPDCDIFSTPLQPFEMDSLSSLDIDAPFDLELARYLVATGRVSRA